MGVLMAGAFVLYLLLRSQLSGINALETERISAAEAVVLWLLAGAIGGLFFGLLLPYTQSRVGASLVGMVAIAPYFVLRAIAKAEATGVGADGWVSVAVASVIVGGVAGYLLRRDAFFDAYYSSEESDQH